MSATDSQPYRQKLRSLMKQAGLTSLESLSQRSQVSTWHLYRIQAGLMAKVSLENAVKIANALQVSIDDLLAQFCPAELHLDYPATFRQADRTESLASQTDIEQAKAETEAVKQEYARLEQQLAEQKDRLTTQFQQASLHTLESWLLHWPTAAAVAEKNPQLSAVKLLTLVKPIEDLLRQWGVEAIGQVGQTLAYDPQWHQLIEGDAVSGDLVWVRYLGYRQGDKLLYRAKVSPFAPERPAEQEDVAIAKAETGQTAVSPSEEIGEKVVGERFDDQFLDDYPEVAAAQVYYYD